MEIFWYGHACFRLRGRGCAVVTDPFDGSLGYELPRFTGTVVTISHDAPFHNKAGGVRGKPYVISGPGDYEIGGVFVTGVRTDLDPKRVPPQKRNTAYLIEIEDVTICHLGNLTDVLPQQQAEDLGPIDVLLIPVGGKSTLTPVKAAEVVNVIEPGYVVPMMYKTPGSKADLGTVTRFFTEMGVEAPEPEEMLKITKSESPETTVVRLLSRMQ